MAAEKDFADYVCENIKSNGELKYKKMFGEDMIYADVKPVLIFCDNTVFVKIMPGKPRFLTKRAKKDILTGVQNYIM